MHFLLIWGLGLLERLQIKGLLPGDRATFTAGATASGVETPIFPNDSTKYYGGAIPAYSESMKRDGK